MSTFKFECFCRFAKTLESQTSATCRFVGRETRSHSTRVAAVGASKPQPLMSLHIEPPLADAQGMSSPGEDCATALDDPTPVKEAVDVSPIPPVRRSPRKRALDTGGNEHGDGEKKRKSLTGDAVISVYRRASSVASSEAATSETGSERTTRSKK